MNTPTPSVIVLALAVCAYFESKSVKCSNPHHRDDDGKLHIYPEFPATTMIDFGIDPYAMPEHAAAWSDWQSDGDIVVGPN